MSAPARSAPSPRRTFPELVRLRAEWREHHERQDRANADRVFREAGVAAVSDLDLKFLPGFFREKLNEFGRDWERALVAQALREGWTFYRVPLRIAVGEAAAFHRWIEGRFAANRPAGAPLFFESNGLRSLQEGAWDALFYVVLPPDAEPEALDLAGAPGVSAPPAKALRIA